MESIDQQKKIAFLNVVGFIAQAEGLTKITRLTLSLVRGNSWELLADSTEVDQFLPAFQTGSETLVLSGSQTC